MSHEERCIGDKCPVCLKAELARVKQECAELRAQLKNEMRCVRQLANDPRRDEMGQAKEAGALSMIRLHIAESHPVKTEEKAQEWMEKWRKREGLKHE